MSSESNKMIVYVVAIILAVVTVAAVFDSAVVIKAGYEGNVFDNSKGVLVDKPLDEGLKWVIPFWQNVEQVEVRTTIKEVTADAVSKDIQKVTSVIALNYHPTKGETPKLYQNVGFNYEERIIAPAIQEVVKAATAKYTAEELVTQRELVSLEMRDMLNKRLAPAHITVEYFSVIDFDFSDSFNEAIEKKQVAEVNIETARNDLERIEIEKDQVITAAEGVARGMEIQAEALKLNSNLIAYEAVQKWDGTMPMFYVTSGDGNTPTLMMNIPSPAITAST